METGVTIDEVRLSKAKIMDELCRAEQVVLGLDPGLNITGYGLLAVNGRDVQVLEAGVLRTKSKSSMENRLVELHEGLNEVLEQHRPTSMAIEELYSHYERPRTAILMGHARGVLCLAAATKKIKIHHYAATQIKRVLTGNGRASKPQMQLAVSRELGLKQPPEPPDVADALAIACCHIYLSNKEHLLT